MKLSKIIAVCVLICCLSSGFAKTYEELEAEFYRLLEIVPSSTKKYLETSWDSVKAIEDKEIKKMILENTINTMPADILNQLHSNGSSSGSTTAATAAAPKTTTSSVTMSTKDIMKKLANKNTYLDQVQYLVANHVFNGAGTIDDPILLSEAWEMITIAYCSTAKDDRFDSIKTTGSGKIMPHSLCFKQTKDLDFGGYNFVWNNYFDESESIYDATSTVFDGNGFAIKNLTATAPLFYNISVNGLIKNLRLENADMNIQSGYSHPSPFCEYLEGVLLNCSFEGKFNAESKTSYDFAYSREQTGVVVGCVVTNSAASRGAGQGITVKASVGSSQRSVNVNTLNDELSTWNALYYKNKNYLVENHFVMESGKAKLRSGAPAAKTIPNKSAPSGAIFSNAHSVTVSTIGKEVYYSGFGFPGGTTILDWTSDSRLSFETNGKTIDQRGKKYPAYTLTLYTRQADGSYKSRVLDDKTAFVTDYFYSGKNRGLYVRWASGGYFTLLLNQDAENSLGKLYIGSSDNAIYGMKIPAADRKELPAANTVKSLISSTQW